MTSRLGLMVLLIVSAASAIPATTVAALPPVEARRPTAPVDIDAVVTQAFARLSDDGPTAMADFLAPYDRESRITPHIGRLQATWQAEVRDDATRRVEFVRQETLGSSIVRYSYLLVLPKRPILWTVTFTSPVEGAWCLRGLKVEPRVQNSGDVFHNASSEGDFSVPRRVAADFAAKFAAGENAIDVLAPHLGAIPAEKAAIEQFGKMLTSLQSIDRTARERVELARYEPLTPSLIRLVYVEHGPGTDGAHELILYRPADRWFLIAFNYQFGNDQVFELLFPGSSENPDSAAPQSAAVPRRSS
ncbi:MAG: hypothetical protein WBC44_14235 [Planctomycetaceae bacterium]